MPTYTWTPGALGALLALLVIIAAFVLAIVGQLEYKLAALFVALGLARLT